MQKKLFYGIAVIAIAVIAAWNVNVSSIEDGLSDVLLANVEALANGEGDEGGEKICHFRGTSEFTDWYTCEGDYPNVNACGNTDREHKWFSADKHVCY